MKIKKTEDIRNIDLQNRPTLRKEFDINDIPLEEITYILNTTIYPRGSTSHYCKERIIQWFTDNNLG